MPGLPRHLVVVAAFVAPLTLVACSDDPPISTEDYCGLIEANLAALNAPALSTAADVAATVVLYTEIAAAAPLAVRAEWETLRGVVETAATVVPGDAASTQVALDTARAAEPAARRVAEYTSTTCALSLAITP